MAEKIKVKFLTAIWGARYVEEFARVSLPSYLAAGNLPFVATETDLEVVVMTSVGSLAKFDEQPAFQKLRSLCPVRFILIDDLITTGNYGVTLTLAYARGILDSGAEQTNTNFVFMNSDFVLADGSLRTLVEKLREQHRCIMAPSLRASAETTLPSLMEAVDDGSCSLTMPPRRMVQLAFDNLHPTVLGKTITQDFVTCATHNQIYWQVDETTLLGRYHLIFMLAIRPEVPMGPVNSYCDYGFVPALVPSGEFTVIDDSDDFFMLEIQPAGQEKQFLRCGAKSAADIADELSVWTTFEHRRFAEVDVVFRSGDPPARLTEVRATAAKFVTNLHRRMTSRPVDYVDHFYWVSGLQAWGTLKFPGEIPVFPPETIATAKYDDGKLRSRWLRVLEGGGRIAVRSYIGLLGFMRRQVGVVPNVPVWDHRWLDSRLILRWVEAIKKGPDKRCVLICGEASSLSASLVRHLPLDVRIGLGNIRGAAPGQRLAPEGAPGARYDHMLIHIERAEVRKLKQILERVEDCVEPKGTISVYIEHPNSELDSSNFSLELAQYVDELLPHNWISYQMKASFAGGRIKRELRLAERFLFRYLWPTSIGRLPHLIFSATLWPLTAALTALNNFRLRNASAKCPDYCSSALLSFVRIPAPARAEGSLSRVRTATHDPSIGAVNQRAS